MEKPKILIVDDKLENLIALEILLEDVEAEIIRADSGNEALAKSIENDFALVLIDVQMPEMDGFETVKLMRRVEKTKYVPIIFVSAIYSDDFYKIKGVESGAVDFITKPIIPEILLGKVTIFLELYEQKKKLENTVLDLQRALIEVETLKGLIPICASCKKVRDDKGFWTDVEHYIAARADVDFSHSICPSCLEKEHPKVYAKLKAKGKI